MDDSRAALIAAARGYIGTPWHHRGRLPGVALDCAGVLVCAARAVGCVPPDFDVPEYTETPDGRSLLEWCGKYMVRVAQSAMAPGDAIVLITDRHPQHLALLGDYRHGGLSIIHAANSIDAPRVIETRLMFSRSLRFVAAFRLPEVV